MSVETAPYIFILIIGSVCRAEIGIYGIKTRHAVSACCTCHYIFCVHFSDLAVCSHFYLLLRSFLMDQHLIYKKVPLLFYISANIYAGAI